MKNKIKYEGFYLQVKDLTESPTLWYEETMDLLFILYPSGKVEILGNHKDTWATCWFTSDFNTFTRSPAIEFLGAL